MFLGPGDEVLYVGTAVDVRRRVRSYFTAGEKRARIGEMLRLAERVRPVPCVTVLEAQVRELRLIAAHKPAYNRRSRLPERKPWLRLTDEPFPRLSVVRSVPAGAGVLALGPFPSQVAADAAIAALQTVFPVRRCRPRLPAVARPGAAACALAEMGRCGAPCTGEQSREAYAAVVARVRDAVTADLSEVAEVLGSRIRHLSGQERFEEAAAQRDGLVALVRAVARTQRLAPLAAASRLVAARRAPAGGWEVILVRFGRLAGTALVARGDDPRPAVAALEAAGEAVRRPSTLGGAATAEESELIAAWLEQPGVRLVELASDEPWAWPVGGAARFLRDLDAGRLVPAQGRPAGP
jgi:DNA polymerase-3 subunit epsilon